MKGALAQLIAGDLPYILVGRDAFPEKTIVLPGSFNPLHHGHEGLLMAAENATGREGLLELSVTNVDKAPLDVAEVERRLSRLRGRYGAVLMRAPTFVEKAAALPGVWFAMGYDTAIRLLSPQYHPDVSALLRHFLAMETRFVVAGRLHKGEFQGVEQLGFPSEFKELFIPIPEELFRQDVSSTELRGE